MQDASVEAGSPSSIESTENLGNLESVARRDGNPLSTLATKSAFAMLWLSETTFDLGTTLISFAIGVWIFAQTGSAQDYSLSVLAATVASMLVTPFAGSFADRYDRRRVVLLCDLAAVAGTVAIAVSFAAGRPAVTALYLYSAGSAAVGTLRRPAIRVAVSGFVARDRFTQFGGLTGISRAIVQIGAPSASGFLMGHFGLPAVLAVQVCLLSAGALLVFGALTRAGQAARGTTSTDASTSMLDGARSAFAGAFGYLRQEPLMWRLLMYGALVQCLMVLATTMLTPMVLSTHSSDALGLVMSVGIVGGMAGSVLVATSVIRSRLMLWVLICDAGQCAAVVGAGWSTSVVPWCIAAFVCLFCGSMSVACSHALWMRKAPLSRQGSIFALLAALNMLVMCIVLFAGGYLADAVLEPAMRQGSSVWHAFGTGKGRGIGLLFAASGTIGLVLTLFALANRDLRRLDEMVPERSDT